MNVTRLTITQSRELLGIPKNEFNLESRFVVVVDQLSIQVNIGGKENDIAEFVGIAAIEEIGELMKTLR